MTKTINVSDTNIQYCKNVLLRISSSCEECGLLGSEKCKSICKQVERLI